MNDHTEARSRDEAVELEWHGLEANHLIKNMSISYSFD
jgi:hypothetical protein